MKKIARSLLPKGALDLITRRRPTAKRSPLDIVVHRAAPGTWVARHLPGLPDKTASLKPLFRLIEDRAKQTAEVGPLPLWAGYAGLEDYPADVSAAAVRSSDEVRTNRKTGELFSWMVTTKQPREIVEIGGAFGISGMYWCAGLSANGAGNFTSFEPNAAWAPLATANIQAILERARLIVGTFEDNLHEVPAGIDIAFIDAIHTPEFVEAQLNLVLERARPGALIVLDDINFSEQMTSYCTAIRDDGRFAAAADISRRVGVLELAG